MKDRGSCCWLHTCSGLMFVGYTAVYFAYVGIGGLIFMVIEKDYNNAEKIPSPLQTVKTKFMKKFPDIDGEQLDDFVADLSSAGLGNFQVTNTTTRFKWTYSESVFFCVTLLTTIGYGHIAPVSAVGKAFSMAFSSLGIPMTIFLIAGCVQYLTTIAVILQRTMATCLQRFGFKNRNMELISFVVAFMWIGLLFFILPAVLFIYLEDNWSYLDAFYFCFISLTTVGLGDYVPGKVANVEYISLYRLGVSLYLLLGVIALGFLMTLANDCTNFIVFNLKNHKREPIEPSNFEESNFEPPSFEPQFSNYGSIVEEKMPLITKPKQHEIYEIYYQTD